MNAGLASYKRTVFPNGLKVITEAIPYVRSVSIGLWIDVGSRDESAAESGVSHFIEHMAFKGTKNRNPHEIASCLESVGGVLNAFTSREQTCIYAKILDRHLPLAVDVIADLAQNALLKSAEIEKEKRVILEEIKDVEDVPSDIVHDKFAEAIFGEHPLGRSILGSKATIRKMTRSSIRKHMNHFYRPDRMLIAASGNVDHPALVESVAKFLNSPGSAGVVPERRAPRFVPRRRTITRKISQAHVCMGVPAMTFDDPSRSASFLLNALLGGGMSSRLFQKLREDLGIVYNVFSYLDYFQDSSVFGISLATHKKNAKRAVEAVMQEIKRVATEPLSPDDLSRVKEQLKGHLMLGLESMSSRMNRIAKHEFLVGRYISLDETVAGIDAVKGDEITQLAGELFAKERFSAVALGQVSGEVFAVLE